MTVRGEDAWTAQLARMLNASDSTDVGIGDDAACVRIGAQDVVIAKDVLVDGRHFVASACGVAAAVYKAVAVNVSDFAAVAAVPQAFVLGVVAPAGGDASAWQAEVIQGVQRAAAAFDVVCVGGDTNVADSPFVFSVTLLGAPGPGGFVTRSGAQVGDVLSVTGPLGGSLHGRHLLPQPRVRAGLALASSGAAHAMLDLSDGLSTDLHRLCAASGVGARIEAEAVPIHQDVASDHPDRLAAALGDGEDFELLVAHAPLSETHISSLAEAGVVLVEIGRCVPVPEGLTLARAGVPEVLTPGGFDHFAPDGPGGV